MIKGVKFASVPTRDQDRAVMFWTEKVGLQVMTDQPFDDNQRWIELGIPSASTSIVLFAIDGQKPGGPSNITFWADDVEKTFREMSSWRRVHSGAPEGGLGHRCRLSGSGGQPVRHFVEVAGYLARRDDAGGLALASVQVR